MYAAAVAPVPHGVRPGRTVAKHGSCTVRPSAFSRSLRSASSRSTGSSVRAAKLDVNGKGTLEGSYLFASATVWLSGVLLLALPHWAMAPLVPGDAPSIAAASGSQALRIAASFAPSIATSLECLSDAAIKGNLVKSATYRRLNTACLVTAASTLLLTTAVYQGENMNNGILALAMIGFTGPVTFATWRGGAAQRALNWDAQWASFKLDLESLKADFSQVESNKVSLFYQSQLALFIIVGIALVLLPASVLESPEPNFTGETLMRRVAGVEALWLQGTVASVLLDASKRDRLGASTFKALNRASAASTLLAATCLSALVAEVSGANASSSLYEAEVLLPLIVGAVPSAVYLYLGLTAKKKA